MAGGHSIMHRSDFERAGNWSLARRSLDLGSFGLNVVEVAPGESIPEHDETARDQEEVFVVLEGEPTVVIDGHDHPAPAGTFVRLDPEPTRTIRNDAESAAHVLMISAPTTSGYRPMDWA